MGDLAPNHDWMALCDVAAFFSAPILPTTRSVVHSSSLPNQQPPSPPRPLESAHTSNYLRRSDAFLKTGIELGASNLASPAALGATLVLPTKRDAATSTQSSLVGCRHSLP